MLRVVNTIIFAGLTRFFDFIIRVGAAVVFPSIGNNGHPARIQLLNLMTTGPPKFRQFRRIGHTRA